MGDTGADSDDMPYAFVARNERRLGPDWPVALGSVQVRVTDAGRGNFDQYLSRAGHPDRDFLDYQRLAEFPDDRGFHCFLHDYACEPEGIEVSAAQSVSTLLFNAIDNVRKPSGFTLFKL